jgi:hypothetical protein
LNLPTTAKQDHLGVAYVRAVAAKAGCTSLCTEGGADFGIDIQVNHVALVDGKPETDGALIQIQLKSVYNAEVKEEHVVYDLEAKDYNRLVRKRYTSRLLVLFRLPREEDRWLTVTPDATTIRHCAYWQNIPQGDDLTENHRTIRIKIPVNQVFDPAALVELMTRVVEGDVL